MSIGQRNLPNGRNLANIGREQPYSANGSTFPSKRTVQRVPEVIIEWVSSHFGTSPGS